MIGVVVRCETVGGVHGVGGRQRLGVQDLADWRRMYTVVMVIALEV